MVEPKWVNIKTVVHPYHGIYHLAIKKNELLIYMMLEWISKEL